MTPQEVNTKTRRIRIKTIKVVLIIVWQLIESVFPLLQRIGFSLSDAVFLESIILFFWTLDLLDELFVFNKLSRFYRVLIKIALSFSVCAIVFFARMYIVKTEIKKWKLVQLGYIFDKDRHSSKPQDLYISVGVSKSKKQRQSISEGSLYNNIFVGDTVLVTKTEYGEILFVTYNPTREQIERYRVPQLYIDGELQAKPPVEQYPAAVRDSALRQSHKQLGFVFEKIDDEYYRHFLRVGIADSLTTLHEFYETDRLYAKAYKRIGVGDTVIVRTADAMPQINQVVNWRPTQSEIQKSRIPAPYTASGAANHTQAFIDSVMQQSHEEMGFVFDKYEDEHVGAYLEVGVSDTLTRTYLFYKYKKPYTNIFKTISIGDTVMLHVPDNYPQINQVVKWKYVKEEEGKPANVAAPKESAESERNASIVDKGIETDFAIVYTKGINSIWPKYFVKLKCNNTISDYIGIDDIYKKQIYESISAGDTVIIQKPKSNSEKIQVLSWEPTPEEIELYRTQVRGTGRKNHTH